MVISWDIASGDECSFRLSRYRFILVADMSTPPQTTFSRRKDAYL